MDWLLISSVIFIGIAGAALQFKNAHRFIPVFNVLTFAVIVQLLIPSFSEESYSAVYSLLAIVGINLLASQVKALQKDYVRILVPLISIAAFLFMYNGQTITFLGDEYISVNKFLVGGAVLAVIGYELGMFKIKILKKILDGTDEKEIMTALLLFFSGIAVFLGSLASSSFGLLVVSAAFLSASFYRKDDTNRIAISVLTLSILPYLLTLVEGETAALLDGDVLEGLFIGAFGMYFIQKLWMSKKTNILAIFAGYAIVLGFSFVMLWTGTIFFKMGGMDALIGVFVGIALVNAIIGKGFVATSLVMLLLSGALIIPTYMVNEEQAEAEVIITAEGGIDKEGNKIPPPTALSLSEIAGDYTIQSTDSKVNFSLGEGGKTKGQFKEVKGSFSINEDMAKSSFDITLPMSGFTTFNGMQEKSLRSDEYFNVAKFPTMKYKATGFKSTGTDTYEVDGQFTMLGVSKPIKVTLMRIEMDGKNVLIGSGEIDRTLFGMTPDASEGNVVSFDYMVELK